VLRATTSQELAHGVLLACDEQIKNKTLRYFVKIFAGYVKPKAIVFFASTLPCFLKT
jgi:hypothetical protein